MAVREFVDGDGAAWQIWSVRPAPRYSSPLQRAERRRKQAQHYYPDRRRALSPNPGMEDGWLCFDCGDEKRRLIPAPAGWATCDEDAIAAYLTAARPIRRRLIARPNDFEQPPFA